MVVQHEEAEDNGLLTGVGDEVQLGEVVVVELEEAPPRLGSPSHKVVVVVEEDTWFRISASTSSTDISSNGVLGTPGPKTGVAGITGVHG